ncbi:hypothetical protein HOI26_04950 [Candidatus Woesearchaeota archaeon]|jgi:hypothetical protein|nr:hypothetical protein [Candidatus Woesearchaeota archaeon]MBT5740419.1 hypothetical protein [Candidatus Woesearchaeota archaeon]
MSIENGLVYEFSCDVKERWTMGMRVSVPKLLTMLGKVCERIPGSHFVGEKYDDQDHGDLQTKVSSEYCIGSIHVINTLYPHKARAETRIEIPKLDMFSDLSARIFGGFRTRYGGKNLIVSQVLDGEESLHPYLIVA